VRDRIPEIIAESGRRLEIVEVEGAELDELLRAKIVEEALEVQGAADDKLVTEVADLAEVVVAAGKTT
jgi:predicted house-cleaning noncanonical NTP pyrophosphatase (MazG superfamily)